MSIKFSDLGISSLLQKGLQDLEISEPTFIQQKAIPVVLHQKEDLVDLAARGIDVKEISYVVHYHLPDTYDTYVHRSGRTARAGAKGFSWAIIQEEELVDIPHFEQELDLSFTALKKGDAKSMKENKGLLWAKKIFKTKPNHEISSSFRAQIGTVFHHLTKEELIDKLLADFVMNSKALLKDKAAVKNRKKL